MKPPDEELKNTIYVTRPSMPSKDEYHQMIDELWESKWLTNDGKFHGELERRLADFLGVDNISLFCNGTIALMVALQMLRLNDGDVITTPFTFPATTHVLYWNRLRPVFCDISPETYNLDPQRVEELITPRTRAIMPVHVYGTPCDVEALQEIADFHGLVLLYDAAHTFGVNYKERALCSYGDASVLSFHATKLFSTGEGGAIVVNEKLQKSRIDYLKNFGIANSETVVGPGINGKMCEFQAAFGLLHLQQVNEEIEKRKLIFDCYKEHLGPIDGLKILDELPDTKRNYAYYPIIVDEEVFAKNRNQIYDELAEHNIFARKYFYPLCSHFPCYRALPSAQPERLPVAERISEQVLCLPIYGSLALEDVKRICQIITS